MTYDSITEPLIGSKIANQTKPSFSSATVCTWYACSISVHVIVFIVYVIVQAGEKDKEDNMVEALGPEDQSSLTNAELCTLRTQLTERAHNNQLDGFGYYL